MAAGEHASQASAIGARHGDKDLFALGHAITGMVLTFTGDSERGLPMVEEATEGAVSGELGPRATGMIYCMMISVNAQVADWQRAGQWTEAATRWCNSQAINGFPGVCRVHRAEIMRLRGALSEAEEEARTATTELGSFNLEFAALAFRELGEVRLKLGDIEGAEDAFRQASEMGAIPQPGLALALVQRGRPQAAGTALRRALADPGLPPLDRSKLLPAQLEVALLLDDVATARSAAAELDTIAASHTSPALRATAEAGAAMVGFADGDLEDAERAAQAAHGLFDHVDLVHEAARMSLLLGQIHRAQGDSERSRRELDAALSVFARIGARPDADRARALLAETRYETPAEPTAGTTTATAGET
jgi:tetratricopeptide (TPR) repeat protein